MMTRSAGVLLLLLLGLCQAARFLPKEYGYGKHPSPFADIENIDKIDKIDDIPEEDDFDLEHDDEDSVDVTDSILSSNNGSEEILWEGDLLAPKTRNAMKCWNQQCLWAKKSNGVVEIPYTVSRDFARGEVQKMVRGMQGFHSSTCIRFVQRSNQRDYISIVNMGGCYSSLGRTGGRQDLSLNRKGCIQHGVIQHEITHALGFKHEQTRSDRDSYVRINFQNIDRDMAYNFDKGDTNNLGTPYDYSSVMHYGPRAFSINGRDSITPLHSGPTIGQRNGLSHMDIQRINLLYGC